VKKLASQKERRRVTRLTILFSARHLFGSVGYNSVTIDQVAADASLAKGAIYHHFATKTELFEAVLQQVAAQIVLEVEEATQNQADILAALSAGNRAFFEACADPEVAQIFLKDGPSVLGWERWRAIDTDHFGRLTREGLLLAMKVGAIAERPVEPLVGLILGAVTEAAIDCAQSDDFQRHSALYLDALEAMLIGLKPRE
jgi:AcrR family transcriptional regulator